METFPVLTKASGAGAAIALGWWFDPAELPKGAVLCVHGLTANLRCWDQIALSLGAEYRFVAMDLRGRGHSDQPATGYCLQAHVEDIRAVLDDLLIGRITLMGHSLGAYVSLAFAAAYPERMERLILVDGGGDLPPEQWERVNQAIKPALARLGSVSPTFEDYVAPLKASPLFQPWTQTIEEYFRYEIIETQGGVRSRIHPENIWEEAESLVKVDVAAMYERVACPTLILRATEGLFVKDDVVLPLEIARIMAGRIAKSRLVEINGAHHYSIVFYPQAERDRAIRDFLSDCGH